jgi:nucleotide-binding universal stress UspA family protein
MPDPVNDFAVFEQLRDAGAALLEKCAQELSSGYEITSVVRVGGASDVIAAVAEENAAEFVIVGSRGLGAVGRLVLGSVSLRLAVSAPCPAVIVPDSGAPPGDGSIMCAVDDSEQSRGAVATAAMLADRLGTKLVLVHVEDDADSPSSHGLELLARLAVESGFGTSVERILLRGDTAGAIVEAATGDAVAMIVIGSRGRGMVASSVLGSVSSAVLERSTCPVTIVRGHGAPAATAASYVP